ncbi:MAG: J domain-containing protein [Desulfobacterales bacterium]|nr:J domain-containing protein [Desulfobacterales bacterium]
MDPRKHYKILEIDRSASLEEARQAYRDLIAVWHPDRYTHNPRLQEKALEKVKAVNAAFEIVSRFILEKGSGKKQPSEGKFRPASAPVQKRTKTVDNRGRAAVWEKTEARLAALARAKELAQAREAVFAREKSTAAAIEEKRAAAAKKARLEAEIQSRNHAKAATEKNRLEKKLARERVWAETEQKLRALKHAKEKVAAEHARKLSGQKAKHPSLGWYTKQILVCGGILLIAFSGNALQSFIHINFTAMVIMASGSFLAWWVATRVKRSNRRKK